MKKFAIFFSLLLVANTSICTIAEKKAIDSHETIAEAQQIPEVPIEFAELLEQLLKVVDKMEFDEYGNPISPVTIEATVDELIENPEIVGEKASKGLDKKHK